MSDVATGTIDTRIPARMDRLPWSRFHWMVVVGLGTVWILDGLEVTIVGNLASRLTDDGTINLTQAQVAAGGTAYIIGACTGALFFGQLTDRFGRKKLFLLTLVVYLVATVATAFTFSAWFFWIARFFTGAGIGGEYAAINSAIDELIPARVRGRIDLIINGSYWIGAAGGSLLSLLLLNKGIFGVDVGWRVAFGLGAVFGLVILLVRRHVPESPRWLFIHGREEEAERIVDSIESGIREETGEELPKAEKSITVRQRKSIPFRTIAKTAFKVYPKRSVLGLGLFIGQAFIYNAVVFTLGLTLTTFFGVTDSAVPVFFAIFAVTNFLGPVTLGRLFDTVGRKPMISGCYIGSAVMLVVTAVLFGADVLTQWSLLALLGVTFFFASAGASAAYLTVSEIFPMETRALAIAFFYAIGTAIGGAVGPLLFGSLIATEELKTAAIGYFIGAGVMAAGGVIELLFGVKAEKANLEDIAKPLTAEEAEEGGDEPAGDKAEGDGAKAEGDGEGVDRASEQQEAVRRIRERTQAHRERQAAGARRFRPGPGSFTGSPAMSYRSQLPPEELDREIEMISRALREHGTIDRRELARIVGARYWGPGVFRAALREAIEDGRATALSRTQIAPPPSERTGAPG